MTRRWCARSSSAVGGTLLIPGLYLSRPVTQLTGPGPLVSLVEPPTQIENVALLISEHRGSKELVLQLRARGRSAAYPIEYLGAAAGPSAAAHALLEAIRRRSGQVPA